MRKTILYIAVSLDGYIADQTGSVDWLNQFLTQEDGYAEFISKVDTILMGAITYRQIITELSPEAWPYKEQQTYVFTHSLKQEDQENHISFCNTSPCALVEKLRAQPGRDIWICGGAQIAQQLILTGAIDEYRLTVAPVLLGGGISFFGTGLPVQRLFLCHTVPRGPFVELIYSSSSSVKTESSSEGLDLV